MNPSWIDNGFVPNQPTPSMDNKDASSPPIRTTEEYDRDCANGFQRIGRAEYGTRKGKSED